MCRSLVASPTEASPEALATAQATLDGKLVTLCTASLPTRTTMVIFTGHSDPRQLASLNAREVAFESAIKSRKKTEELDRSEWWTASDGKTLEEDGRKGQARVVVLTIKETCVYGSTVLI